MKSITIFLILWGFAINVFAGNTGFTHELKCTSIPKGFDLRRITFEAAEFYSISNGATKVKVDIKTLRDLPCKWRLDESGHRDMEIGDHAALTLIPVLVEDETGKYNPKGSIGRISFDYVPARDGKGLHYAVMKISLVWDYELKDEAKKNWRYVGLRQGWDDRKIHLSWDKADRILVSDLSVASGVSIDYDPRIKNLLITTGE